MYIYILRNINNLQCRLFVRAQYNKAIRDGKYIARHMSVLGNVHPIKIEKFDIISWRHFSDRSSFYIFTR